MADTLMFVMKLTIVTTSKRYKRGITTDPLITASCFYQRDRIVTTKTAMLAWNYFCFHSIICHYKYPFFIKLSHLAFGAQDIKIKPMTPDY